MAVACPLLSSRAFSPLLLEWPLTAFLLCILQFPLLFLYFFLSLSFPFLWLTPPHTQAGWENSWEDSV